MVTNEQHIKTLQEILQKKLSELREKNPQFSGRAFAKRLGVSPGALSEILRGNRIITHKLALRFCERLMLDPSETAAVIKRYPSSSTANSAKLNDLESIKLSNDTFKLMSEWQHFAILAFMKTSHFKPEVAYIADRMGVSARCVELAVQTLTRLGLIQVDAEGNWHRSQAGHRTTDGLKDASVRKSHVETLDLARASMDNTDFQETDYTSLTFPLDKEDIPAARRKIRKFQTELFEEFNHDKKSKEVYRVAVQLFPLTKSAPKRNLL